MLLTSYSFAVQKQDDGCCPHEQQFAAGEQKPWHDMSTQRDRQTRQAFNNDIPLILVGFHVALTWPWPCKLYFFVLSQKINQVNDTARQHMERLCQVAIRDIKLRTENFVYSFLLLFSTMVSSEATLPWRSVAAWLASGALTEQRWTRSCVTH